MVEVALERELPCKCSTLAHNADKASADHRFNKSTSRRASSSAAGSSVDGRPLKPQCLRFTFAALTREGHMERIGELPICYPWFTMTCFTSVKCSRAYADMSLP